MKVKIGPYINWWGPYQILELLTHLGLKKETTEEWAERCPKWIVNFLSWVHSKRERTIKVRIDKYDTWSMDSTLALIIPTMLRQLKATKHGTPMSVFDDEVDETGNPTIVSHDKAIKEWDLILDKMIWSFERLADNDDGYQYFNEVEGEIDFSKYPEDDGQLAVPLRWKVEPKTNWEAYYAYQEHIDEGLTLFGKHYRSLWD